MSRRRDIPSAPSAGLRLSDALPQAKASACSISAIRSSTQRFKRAQQHPARVRSGWGPKAPWRGGGCRNLRTAERPETLSAPFLNVLYGFQHRVRIGRRRHGESLIVDAVGYHWIVAADFFEKSDDL